ncbi:endonuclease/exonuclease/phosphatase family protein [Kutzneria sp. NPDC051319]|uniref:endonuclease/exonuclease/phosphatase family protein n=1 Tax=Kutzneria sp. NPDC051319 TaxID=3155047 RepID=UPI00344028A7
MRFATINLEHLYQSDSAREQERLELVCDLIRALRADVLAVQEVYAESPSRLGRNLVDLANRVGMSVFSRTPMNDASPEDQVERMLVGISPHDLHVALLYSDRVECQSGSFRSYDNDNLHHGLIKATFDVPGSDGSRHLVRHGSVHLTPFGPRGGRADEAARVVSAFAKPLIRPAGLVGGDYNTVCADRTLDGDFYDLDPYADRDWSDACVYQCRWEYDERGRRTRWWADREPGDILYAGGLLDATVALNNSTVAAGGLRWKATTGHRSETVAFGPRRICGVRVTEELVPALHSVEIADTAYFVAQGRQDIRPEMASDHFAEVVTYDPALIAVRSTPR